MKNELKEFTIPFSGLKQGKHEYGFVVDNTFFDAFGYQEFNSTTLQNEAVLNKMSNMMELELRTTGTVNVDCDVTGEPFDLSIEGDLKLVVKFGEFYDDENDEILILPHGEHQLNIAQYVYEMSVLAVPQKKVHPGVLDGSLKSKVLDKLNELQPKEEKTSSEDNDPRWDDLKKLLTDK